MVPPRRGLSKLQAAPLDPGTRLLRKSIAHVAQRVREAASQAFESTAAPRTPTPWLLRAPAALVVLRGGANPAAVRSTASIGLQPDGLPVAAHRRSNSPKTLACARFTGTIAPRAGPLALVRCAAADRCLAFRSRSLKTAHRSQPPCGRQQGDGVASGSDHRDGGVKIVDPPVHPEVVLSGQRAIRVRLRARTPPSPGHPGGAVEQQSMDGIAVSSSP